MIRLLAIAIAILYGFSAIRFLVGRKSELGFFDYIVSYVVTPLYNLNYFVNKTISFNGFPKETFLSLWNNFARLGIGEVQNIQREVVTVSGLNVYLGNTYTAFRDYYSDLGFFGVIIFVSIQSLVISSFYASIRSQYLMYDFKIIIYAYLSTSIVFMFFTEQFYSSYFSAASFVIIFMMYFVYSILVSKKIHIIM